MDTLIVNANQTLYASKAWLNDALLRISVVVLGQHHAIQLTDYAAGVCEVDG